MSQKLDFGQRVPSNVEPDEAERMEAATSAPSLTRWIDRTSSGRHPSRIRLDRPRRIPLPRRASSVGSERGGFTTPGVRGLV